MKLIKYYPRFLAPLFAFLVSGVPLVAAEKSPPNFLVIFIDDMGYGDLSCYGNTEVKTPPHRRPCQAELTQLLTDKSIEFLEENKDQPFFLYLSHIMRHVVIDASPKLAVV